MIHRDHKQEMNATMMMRTDRARSMLWRHSQLEFWEHSAVPSHYRRTVQLDTREVRSIRRQIGAWVPLATTAARDSCVSCLGSALPVSLLRRLDFRPRDQLQPVVALRTSRIVVRSRLRLLLPFLEVKLGQCHFPRISGSVS